MSAAGQFWDAAFRPLFLATALCAIAGALWWPLGLPMPGLLPAGLWHAHEMLFGFAGAAVGGYLLTALPSWTGMPPISGRPLVFLTLSWILARIAAFHAGYLTAPVLALAGAGYFLFLAILLLRRIVAAKSWGKLGFVFIVLILGGTDAVLLWSVAEGHLALGRDATGTAVLLFAMLMSQIGGKAVPAFTRNWLSRSGHGCAKSLPRSPLPATVLLAGAILCETTGYRQLAGIHLVSSSALLLRLMRDWRSLEVRSEPLLVALHLGFLWLPVGLGLAGLARLMPLPISDTEILHVLTVGAMGGLVFAMAGRAAAHRDNGRLRASPRFATGVALIWLAACVRVLLPENLALSGTLWCLGWAAFTLDLLPNLGGPVERPILSGRRLPAPAGRENTEWREA
ncbi:NnrS family protein [Ruegeria sediminis]|uniref:NnrS family protein n=1 Tax=Ruegeria sediminis TaxID=2583820 RepID=A0ABY2WUS1_9RHOB|nr:NnrS family protein [Ruegeria sediminis]TMV06333.1 NnrS family protein [Ruegeria sediminis]